MFLFYFTCTLLPCGVGPITSFPCFTQTASSRVNSQAPAYDKVFTCEALQITERRCAKCPVPLCNRTTFAEVVSAYYAAFMFYCNQAHFNLWNQRFVSSLRGAKKDNGGGEEGGEGEGWEGLF